jgi:hypothetical protein
MLDKKCNKLMNTKCDRDYKNKHFWQRRGTIFIAGEILMIWQCTHCEKCVKEDLEFL